jgi:hypothetical protein
VKYDVTLNSLNLNFVSGNNLNEIKTHVNKYWQNYVENASYDDIENKVRLIIMKADIELDSNEKEILDIKQFVDGLVTKLSKKTITKKNLESIIKEKNPGKTEFEMLYQQEAVNSNFLLNHYFDDNIMLRQIAVTFCKILIEKCNNEIRILNSLNEKKKVERIDYEKLNTSQKYPHDFKIEQKIRNLEYALTKKHKNKCLLFHNYNLKETAIIVIYIALTIDNTIKQSKISTFILNNAYKIVNEKAEKVTKNKDSMNMTVNQIFNGHLLINLGDKKTRKYEFSEIKKKVLQLGIDTDTNEFIKIKNALKDSFNK